MILRDGTLMYVQTGLKLQGVNLRLTMASQLSGLEQHASGRMGGVLNFGG